MQSGILKSQRANVKQDEQSKEICKLYTDSSVILLCKPQSWLFQAPDCNIEKCILRENKILSTKLRILFHVLFVGVGLCSTEIKGLDGLRQDAKKRPFYKRICFLSLSMNQFTWYTISIVGLKSISAKCLGWHW